MQSQSRGLDLDDEISLLDLWRIVLERWWIISGAALGVGIFAAAATFLITPAFEARAVIMEVDANEQRGGGAALLGQLGGLADLAGVNLEGLQRNARDGKALIQSRTFVEEFIARNNLLPLLYPEEWDPSVGSWRADLERPPTVWEGAEEFKRRVLRVGNDPESGLMSLAVEWTDRDTAAKWANELVLLANEIARQRDIAGAERSSEYLNQQIEKTKVIELQRVLYNLLETELRTLILANAREDYAFRVVDRAVPPIYRSKPRRTLITAFGIAVGGLFGLLIVMLHDVASLRRERRRLAAEAGGPA